MGVWTETKHGRGEDAEPLVLHNFAEETGLVAVFDGAGGAGAAHAGRSPQGEVRTHAWTAARAARALTAEWFLRRDPHADGDQVEVLRGHLAKRLPELQLPVRRKFRGSMVRELPTTLAALHYDLRPGQVRWQALWAGDSRCYLLDAAGLQQLSRDDTESDDTLTLLADDPVMTNMVCADRPFAIHAQPGEAAAPCLLVCATDGFFGYVRTPAEFEYILLSTLIAAEDSARWGDALASAVSSYTADDASLALIAVGFPDFGRLQATFHQRAEMLHVEHVEPTRRAEGDLDALVAARTDSWHRYRTEYERRMPGRSDETE